MKLRRHCVQVGFKVTPVSPIETINGPRCFFFRRNAMMWMYGMKKYLKEPYFYLWIDKA